MNKEEGKAATLVRIKVKRLEKKIGEFKEGRMEGTG